MITDPNKSAGSLLGDALTGVSSLVRSEVDLARAEINESLSSAGSAIISIAAGAIIALTALNVASVALVAALADAGMGPGWAALLVAVVFAIVAVVMLRKGMNAMKLVSLAPSRTAKNLKRDAKAIKEVYNDK